MKKISLESIAKQLGVSKTLVSLVLNDRGDSSGISKKTQKKVIDLAKELNYKPNLMARSLRTGKSKIIGLIVADIANPFYAKLSRGIEDYASKNGYDLIICSSDENVEKEAKLIRMLRERQIDGLIISSTQESNSETLTLIEEDFPLVLIDRYFPHIDANSVLVDNFRGAYNAVQHLIKQKHKKIAFLTITPTYISSLYDRYLGYEAALNENGFKIIDNMIAKIPFNDVYNGVAVAMDGFIKNKADAVFSANNSLTMKVLEYALLNNIKIPETISLVSFDDLDLFQLSNPPITSVAQPINEICETSIKLLLNDINKKQVNKEQIFLDTQLIIRNSSIKINE